MPLGSYTAQAHCRYFISLPFTPYRINIPPEGVGFGKVFPSLKQTSFRDLQVDGGIRSSGWDLWFGDPACEWLDDEIEGVTFQVFLGLMVQKWWGNPHGSSPSGPPWEKPPIFWGQKTQRWFSCLSTDIPTSCYKRLVDTMSRTPECHKEKSFGWGCTPCARISPDILSLTLADFHLLKQCQVQVI